jgi:putative (di)nucleoside polyphosphate hydrolase|tara:strand:+ start:595 stop:1062 length:468 start_codon:yes stop_codon:yes gene_type:complete
MSKLKELPYRNGVGIMLINDNKKIFVGKRIDNKSAWQMPQGGVDQDENIVDAVKRELKEETGVSSIKIIKKSDKIYTYDLPDYLLGKIWKGRFKGQKQTWFLAQFLGTDDEINLDQKNAEFKEWKWVGINELPDLIVPFKKNLYQELVKEFESFI